MEGMDKKQCAVFDIDGTIFRSSLFVELVEQLIEEGAFPESARKGYEKELSEWQNRDGHYNDYIQKMIEVYSEHVKGLHIDKVIEVSNRVLHFQRQHVYRYTRDLIKKLQPTHFMLAISHSPFYIAEPFAREMGFQKIYAVWYEEDENGFLTGGVKYEDLIFHKGRVLQRAIEKENLVLDDSYGVGDSESDISMLEMVEHPIAFNPSNELYKVAKKNGWQVVVERKDVVYHIQ